MLSGSKVLIVTPDRLAGIGLRSILESYFAPAAVLVTADAGSRARLAPLRLSLSFRRMRTSATTPW